MGFIDKLKNIFFEEDEDDDEIEDSKPLKTTKNDDKVDHKIKLKKEEKEEKKEKIEKDEKEEIKISNVQEKKEEVKEEKKNTSKVKINSELIFDDEDFIFDTKEKNKEEPKKEIKKRETPVISKKVEIPFVKPKEVKQEVKKEKIEPVKPKESYVYTSKVERKTKTFTPSPIISPIYGILDKNYKKEEVKENTEIRLSSRPSRVDFDSVRNKAFGDLEYDLFDDVKDDDNNYHKLKDDNSKSKNKKKIEKSIQKDDDSKPTVDKVTIGEADEYYNDLGLAYNTDYKDLSKEENDGKVKEKNNEDNLEDNLFDLIESMYDKEE